MFQKVKVETTIREGLINITDVIQEAVRASGVREGICVLYVPHTTAAITINSCLDPATLQDLAEEMHRLVPTRVDFHHMYDTPSDAAGHIKAMLVGHSITLMVSQGEIALGGSQSILFFEFDGPRQREVWLQVLPNSNG